TDSMISRYRARIGGPVLDRIDLAVAVERIDPSQIVRRAVGESSAQVRERVTRARAHAAADLRPAVTSLAGAALLDASRLDARGAQVLTDVCRAHHLSARGVTRLLRVARTVADLECAHRVRIEHIMEALAFRREDLR
ncbi:MAG TPA: ATP-binding protein, partial [Coriobacteriia bacterium]|nr:ATP-binding protein [Coriobacteriia bacterium]